MGNQKHTQWNPTNSSSDQFPTISTELDETKANKIFLELVTNTTPFLLYIFDLKIGRNIWVNKFHKDNILLPEGKDHDSISKEDIFSMVHPDDVSSLLNISETLEVRTSTSRTVEYRLKWKDGSWKWFSDTITTFKIDSDGKITQILGIAKDITERKAIETERDLLILNLQTALDQIKTLRGIIPICMHCKNIRDHKGYWNNLEDYLIEHSEADMSHGICPKCADKYYPDEKLYDEC